MGQDEAIDYEAFPERRCRSFGERQGAGVKRMHVLSYLIPCGLQRGVPRIIGRAIRGTLSHGAKIIDVFRAKLEFDMKITHAVHTQILCGFQSHIPQTVIAELENRTEMFPESFHQTLEERAGRS